MGFTQEEPVSVPDSMVFFFFLRHDGDVDTSMSSAVMIKIVERQRPFK